MCIRDRGYLAPTYAILEGLFLGGISLFFAGMYNGIVLQACLLYTSDAADERSSVDLGGRRIIKKKKCTRMIWSRST